MKTSDCTAYKTQSYCRAPSTVPFCQSDGWTCWPHLHGPVSIDSNLNNSTKKKTRKTVGNDSFAEMKMIMIKISLTSLIFDSFADSLSKLDWLLSN